MIEDAQTGETIKVATAGLARYLEGVLNSLDVGEPWPDAGSQHHPQRFQLSHDPAWPTPRAGVVYVHGMSARVVALAPRNDPARRIAKVLNRVDYPMIERARVFGLPWPPRIGEMDEPVEDLPPASWTIGSAPGGKRRALRPRFAVFLFASFLPITAAFVLAALAVGWPIVESLIGVVVVVLGVGWLLVGR